MNSTTIRVCRSRKVTIEDYVDVIICQDDDDHHGAGELAVDLVQAKLAAGQDIDWVEVSEKEERYPRPTISAVNEPVMPPPAPPSRPEAA